MPLHSDIAALRGQPGVCLTTLRRVDTILAQYAGQRLTLLKGEAKAARLQQARAFAGRGSTLRESVQAIVRGLGCSDTTAYRYARQIGLSVPQDPSNG